MEKGNVSHIRHDLCELHLGAGTDSIKRLGLGPIPK